MEFLKAFYTLIITVIENFNFAWLFLIIIFLFKENIIDLINRIQKFTIGDKHFEFLIADTRRELLLSDMEIESKYGDFYGQSKVKGVGGGGAPGDVVIDKSETVFLIYDNEVLKKFYEENNSIETIKRMFNVYKESYVAQFNIKTDDNEVIVNDMKQNSPMEVEIFNTLVRFYRITIAHEETHDLWNFSDILKYKRIIITALNLRSYHSNG